MIAKVLQALKGLFEVHFTLLSNLFSKTIITNNNFFGQMSVDDTVRMIQGLEQKQLEALGLIKIKKNKTTIDPQDTETKE